MKKEIIEFCKNLWNDSNKFAETDSLTISEVIQKNFTSYSIFEKWMNTDNALYNLKDKQGYGKNKTPYELIIRDGLLTLVDELDY